ncbi:peptidase inhibitor family I36 protein [Saccharothrix mutabilis subsp. mutabilis]|uniref:Peptidase inhibitor family I36 protein n=1 Tax=Saccharothrix mutabilis subsp. mutabilis TaxID=66855 RepID=A0ABN0UU13_9PSEU
MTTRSLLTTLVLTAAALASSGTASARQPETRVGQPESSTCDRGEFCAWPGTGYTGRPARLDLETANPGECIPLPDGLVARSFVNNLTRDTTVFQGATCSTEAEFTTYPGKGTYVPDAPFVVRAIEVWGP